MSKTLDFTKMSAYGNDYVYVIDISENLKNRGEVSRIISERSFSVGSDGMIVIGKSENADFFMRVYNPDGTEAEMCGNGLRSSAKLVYEKGLTDKTEFTFETLGGIKKVSLDICKNKVKNITADIGRPEFDSEKIPLSLTDIREYRIGKADDITVSRNRLIGEELKFGEKEFYATALSLGNPHLVLFCECTEEIDAAHFGPICENCRLFPHRTNVEFCSFLTRNIIKLRTWERGTGETNACATGCCACAAAGVLADKCDRKVSVIQKGGITQVEWDDNGHLHMTAPSEIVFEGKISLPDKYFRNGTE